MESYSQWRQKDSNPENISCKIFIPLTMNLCIIKEYFFRRDKTVVRKGQQWLSGVRTGGRVWLQKESTENFWGDRTNLTLYWWLYESISVLKFLELYTKKSKLTHMLYSKILNYYYLQRRINLSYQQFQMR